MYSIEIQVGGSIFEHTYVAVLTCRRVLVILIWPFETCGRRWPGHKRTSQHLAVIKTP